MKSDAIAVASVICLSSLVVIVTGAPFVPLQNALQLGNSGNSGSSGNSGNAGLGGLTNILSQIDLPGLLRGINSFVKLVGVFCPPCSQILDNVIQNVTSTAFRVFGRAILQGGGLGGGGGSGSGGSGGGGGGNSVSVVLPTFPPDEDDEDYEETTSEKEAENIVSGNEKIGDVKNENKEKEEAIQIGDIKTESENENLKNGANTNDANLVIRRRQTREARSVDEDQSVAESAPLPSQNLEDDDLEDDQNRDKRGGFLFGAGNAGGGSGNFLFDIIRNGMDRAGRALGTVYRMVAGTQNFNNFNQDNIEGAESTNSRNILQLVAGSGATENSDEKENSPEEGHVDHQGKSDFNGEGIPGPITRLLVIANRGVANLVQDLILRLAQTSERLVNFKARLVTSLI